MSNVGSGKKNRSGRIRILLEDIKKDLVTLGHFGEKDNRIRKRND